MHIDVRILKKGVYKVLEDVTYKGVTVPKDFVYDGASVPLVLTPIIPRMYGTAKASLFHDYMCRVAKNKEDRREADVFFRDFLIEEGMSEERAKAAFQGVRLGAALGLGVYYPHWTDNIKNLFKSKENTDGLS